MSSDVRLVCFDLGRVLIRICENWAHASEVAWLSVIDELDPALRGEYTTLLTAFDSGHSDMLQFADGLSKLRKVSPADVIRMHEVYLRGPYPGAFELVDELVSMGITTACLSNTTDMHWQQMHDRKGPNFLPLEKLKYRFASFQMGCRKPNERIYRMVEEATGLSGPQILFFDDLPDNIQTASKLGWNAQQIMHDGEPIRQVRGHLLRFGVLPG
jgi:FMN phosphatase YigB (HAD superfamily)